MGFAPLKWLWKRVGVSLDRYVDFAVGHVHCMLVGWTLVPVLIIAIGFLAGGGAPNIETDISGGDYLRADGVVADRFDVLNAALKTEAARKRAGVSLSRRMQGTDDDVSHDDVAHDDVAHPSIRNLAASSDGRTERGFADWNFDLLYEAVNGNVFDPVVLADIRRIEVGLTQLPSYEKFCLGRERRDPTCRSLLSPMNFFHGTRFSPGQRLPSRLLKTKFGELLMWYNSTVPSDNQFTAAYIYPDGANQDMQPVSMILSLMAEERNWEEIGGNHGRTWYFDGNFPNSRLMRSKAWFGTPLPGFDSRSDRREQQIELYRNFLEDEVFPYVVDASTDNVKLYFQGGFLTDHEISVAVGQDAMWALASFFLVFVFMTAYTCAPVLSALGMALIVLALPLATVFYALLGHKTFPVINIIALFLLTGIGADNLFVLSDHWRQSKNECGDLAGRMKLTLRRAGKAVTSCCITTAASFLANAGSAIRPLRWFGVFVGLCVLCNLVLSLGFFPLILLLRESPSLFRNSQASSSPSGPPPQFSAVSSPAADATDTSVSSLQNGQAPAPASPVPLLAVPETRTEKWLFNVYAPLLYKLRYVVIICGIMLTLGCLVLVSQSIELSREPPVFFAPGSHNLGDIPEKKSAFGNASTWQTGMEVDPLQVCSGCNWDEPSSSRLGGLDPMQCKRLGADCKARPCAGAPGVADQQPCGGRGQCDAKTARCTCSKPFVGADCRRSTIASARDCPSSGPLGLECSGQGICNKGVCWCNRGWSDDDCTAPWDETTWSAPTRRDCAWGSWKGWSECSKPCGWGQLVRHREVARPGRSGGVPCSGRGMQTDTCKKKECDIDCAWGVWAEWSECNTLCGDGTQRRARMVSTPARGQGSSCSGDALEIATCSKAACPPDCTVGAWSTVGTCSVTCGGGIQLQRRTVTTNNAAASCPTLKEQQVPCEQGACPDECTLGAWTNVVSTGGCTATCGTGLQQQRRNIAAGSPATCPDSESGKRLRTVLCSVVICPVVQAPVVSCNYGSWSEWGSCSPGCGPATRFRSHLSTQSGCRPKSVSETCTSSPRCPTDCSSSASDWQASGACSVTCGTGLIKETRSNAPPGCPKTRVGDCAAADICPERADCVLGEWFVTGGCSVTCGDGTLVQNRRVLQFGVHGGVPCPSETSPERRKTRVCSVNPAVCPAANGATTSSPSSVDTVALTLGLYGRAAGTSLSSSEDAELRRHIADFLGVPASRVSLQGGTGRRLADSRFQVSVSVSDADGVAKDNLDRLQKAIKNGELHTRLRNGPGFDKVTSVGIVDKSGTPKKSPTTPSTTTTVGVLAEYRNLPSREVAKVNVVFGLKDLPLEDGGSGYDENFDFAKPSTQMLVMQMCEAVMAQAEKLAVREPRCFLDDFKVWLATQGEGRFPSRRPDPEMHSKLNAFVTSYYSKAWRKSVGFGDDGQRVKWVSLQFAVNLAQTMPASQAWDWAQRWDTFIEERNVIARDRGPGNLAFHTSSLWVRAETEIRIVYSTLECAGISIFCSLAVVIIFTGNLALAVYLILSIMCVIVCLAALMFGVLGWSFGAVEAVGFIVFVGFTVDYTLHMAESFNQSKQKTRFSRVQEALFRTGGAVFASAVTSFLGSLPLLLCTIQLFPKFGLSILMNTVLSLLFSLGFFCAVLSVIGPVDSFGSIFGLFVDDDAANDSGHPGSVVSPANPMMTTGSVVGAGGGASGGTAPGATGYQWGQTPAHNPASGYKWTDYDDDPKNEKGKGQAETAPTTAETQECEPEARALTPTTVSAATRLPGSSTPSVAVGNSVDTECPVEPDVLGRPAEVAQTSGTDFGTEGAHSL